MPAIEESGIRVRGVPGAVAAGTPRVTQPRPATSLQTGKARGGGRDFRALDFPYEVWRAPSSGYSKKGLDCISLPKCSQILWRDARSLCGKYNEWGIQITLWLCKQYWMNSLQ